jgi:alkylation response protein AidB-like acyl-CoA dehydrogenase
MRFQGLTALSEAVLGRPPGPQASINKIFWSEYSQKFHDRLTNLRGSRAMVLPPQAPGCYEPDDLTYDFLFSRSSSIWGGTAEVQRNIVAERVLGLPKDR